MTDQEWLEFMTTVGKLKRTVRTGWKLKGIRQPENVSDHMFRMGVLSFFIDNSVKIGEVTHCIDKNKVLKMSLIHDLAEAIVGDITPHCGIDPNDKFKLELDAMNKMVDMLRKSEKSEAADEIMSLWQEYNQRSSPESILCKDFDCFEMILQASEYEQEQSADLQDFFDSTSGKFKTDLVAKWVKLLHDKRNK
ncbi:hypothetical protein Ciccas_002272 [Cichlidogyrus casuarinus]|uniref:5'-deoxynucleotidase HDDC2 n=1 Tax=Cichlidogyrus casuarinus TaxID=1844966 RepID=A0ABD2QHQ4_9PLAT